MVHRAHLIDEGWWALSEMPQAWTYGEHSYNKGADVLHTLRSYLGDEAFSAGLTSFLATYAFQPVNTAILRDHLSQSTGMDMTDFFADWIEQPGWAAFEIETVNRHAGWQRVSEVRPDRSTEATRAGLPSTTTFRSPSRSSDAGAERSTTRHGHVGW